MRPLEILLFVAILLTAGVLIVPPIRNLPFVQHLALITALIAVIQMLVEGVRWQMIPAYVMVGGLVAVWLLENVPAMKGVGEHLRQNHVVMWLTGGIGIVWLAVSLALPIVLPVFQFPQPSGTYGIGTVTYHWVDVSRHEIFSPDLQARRELMAQVWYPATDDAAAARAPYMQEAESVTPALARLFHLPTFAFGHFKYVTTHATEAPPIATDKPSYPVLIFLTGLNGFRQSNMFQVEELVSHGYIVVGIDQPYAATAVVFPDERQVIGWVRSQMQPLIQQSLEPADDAPSLNGQPLAQGILPYFAQDVGFTLDQLVTLNQADPNNILTGRLDLQRVGAFGISLGSMVAGEACHADARLKACLMMDAAMPADVVRDGLTQPSLWITRDAATMRLEREKAGGWTEADITQTLTSMRAVFENPRLSAGYYVQMPGLFHVNFTDAPRYSPLMSLLGLTGPLDAQRGFDIVNAYSLAFFEQHLMGHPQSLLDGTSRQYPEAIFEAHKS